MLSLRFAVCAAIVLASPAALAQSKRRPPPTPDTVVLKDGDVLRGVVIEKKKGNRVVIRLPDGEERVIPWREIERVKVTSDEDEAAPDEADPVEAGSAEDAEARRAAWAQRGGVLGAFSIQGTATGIRQSITSQSVIVRASGQQMTFTEKNYAGGGGGGVGVSAAMLIMKAPMPTESNTLFAARLGVGLDFSANVFGYPTPSITTPTYSKGSETKTTSDVTFAASALIGAQLGSGSFAGESRWRGVVVGVDYRPSYVYSLPGQGSSTGAMNFLGFQATVDVKSLEASAAKFAPTAGFRASAFVLPPVGDLPLLVTIGFGAVWY